MKIWIARSLLLLAVCIAATWVFSSAQTWMHPEIYLAESRHLQNSHGLSRFFDCQAISDDCKRTRFLSYLTSYENTYFRVAAWRFLPQHASLSLTWPLTIASLFFFYGTIRNLTRDRAAALLSTGLYVLSAGFLSMLVLLFNPAKPLASFFVIVSLWLGTEIQKRETPWLWAALYASMLLGFFSDETAWFVYVALPILLPSVFFRRSWYVAGYVLTAPLFLAYVTWIAPITAQHYWKETFDFWGWTFAPKGEIALTDRFSAGSILQNAQSMAISQTGIWGLALLGALAFPKHRALLLRAAVLLAMFVLFQSVLMLRQANVVGQTVSGTYYYGALFSVFFMLFVGVAFAQFRFPFAVAIAIYLGITSAAWFLSSNEGWIAGHNKIYADYLHLPEEGARDIWKVMEHRSTRRP